MMSQWYLPASVSTIKWLLSREQRTGKVKLFPVEYTSRRTRFFFPQLDFSYCARFLFNQTSTYFPGVDRR